MQTKQQYPSGLSITIQIGTSTATRKISSTQRALPSLPRPHWQDDADCLGYPLEAFFGSLDSPLTAKESKFAKEICRSCPVQVDCLATALRDNEDSGIWGGTTPVERKRALRRHGTWTGVIEAMLIRKKK